MRTRKTCTSQVVPREKGRVQKEQNVWGPKSYLPRVLFIAKSQHKVQSRAYSRCEINIPCIRRTSNIPGNHCNYRTLSGSCSPRNTAEPLTLMLSVPYRCGLAQLSVMALRR